MKNKIEKTKFAVNVIVGLGAGKIVNQTVKNNTNPEKTRDKVAIGAGSAVLGMMAADATASYTDSKIDELVVLWNQTKTYFAK